MDPKIQQSTKGGETESVDLNRAGPLPVRPRSDDVEADIGETLTPTERLDELLDGISDERLAAIEARVNDPGYEPRPTELRGDHDPFGMDWSWAELGERRVETGEEGRTAIDRFDETMALFDDEALARLDAELEARRNDPSRPAPRSRLRDEVRDPFGMDWAWADGRDDGSQD